MRDQPTERYIRAPRSRTSALLQGIAQASIDRLFVGAHPVRDKPTERYTAAWLSRTGCAPTDKPARQADGAMPKADAQRGSALSPLRCGALRCSGDACRTIATLPSPSSDMRSYSTRCYELLIYRPFSLGYFSLTPGILPSALRAGFAVRMRSCACVGQQEKSDSAAGRQSKRPLRKRPGRGNATSNTAALDPGLRRDDQQNHQGARATGPCNTANTLFATRPTGPNLSVIIPINRKSSSLQ